MRLFFKAIVSCEEPTNASHAAAIFPHHAPKGRKTGFSATHQFGAILTFIQHLVTDLGYQSPNQLPDLVVLTPRWLA